MAIELEKVDPKLTQYLNGQDGIVTQNLMDFAIYAVEAYGSEEKLAEAHAVANYLVKFYTKKKIITPNADPAFIDLMKVTCFIHNVFGNEPWINVFKARESLQDIAIRQFKISWENAQHIFSMVEAQLGTDMPVVACHVKPGTPQDDFVTACWVVKEFNKAEEGKA